LICFDQLLILNLQAGRTDSGSTVGRQPSLLKIGCVNPDRVDGRLHWTVIINLEWYY